MVILNVLISTILIEPFLTYFAEKHVKENKIALDLERQDDLDGV